MPKPTKDDILRMLKEDIHAAEEVAERESIENARLYERYRGKKMGNEQAGRSQIVSTDVFEAVEWALPALMDIFDVNNNIPEFEGHGQEDEEAARKMTQLARYQFWRQNDGETLLRQTIKDALLYRPGGIIKYCWIRETERNPKTWSGLTADEYGYLQSRPDTSITGVTISEDGFYDVEGEFHIATFDGPRFYHVPPWEFLRHPNTRNIEDSPFVAHKKKVTVDYVRRLGQSGFFTNTEKALEDAQSPPPSEQTEDKIYAADSQIRDPEKSSDSARKEVDLYECYVRMDVDGDGLLENRIITMVGDTIVRDVENVYKRPPFVILKCIEDTHKIAGITLAEIVEDLQRLNTFMLRQTVDNLAQSNNSRKVYDPTRISQPDLMLNVPGAPIRTTRPGVDVRTALMELPTQPIQPTVLSFYQIAKELGEQRTGIGKSFRGVGDSSNETASGQFQAINQASQRIRMMAKIMGTSLSELFRAMVYMNKTFLTQKTVVRLENEPLEIAPDDLTGEMDLILNVFLGAATRQQTIVNVQQLLAIFGQLMTAGIPALDANNLPNLTREIVKAMGFKSPDRFLPLIFQGSNPAEGNQAMMQLQMQNAMMEGGAGGAGGSTPGSMASAGQGSVATTNPAGAGSATGAVEFGSGSMVPGF